MCIFWNKFPKSRNKLFCHPSLGNSMCIYHLPVSMHSNVLMLKNGCIFPYKTNLPGVNLNIEMFGVFRGVPPCPGPYNPPAARWLTKISQKMNSKNPSQKLGSFHRRSSRPHPFCFNQKQGWPFPNPPFALRSTKKGCEVLVGFYHPETAMKKLEDSTFRFVHLVKAVKVWV